MQSPIILLLLNFNCINAVVTVYETVFVTQTIYVVPTPKPTSNPITVINQAGTCGNEIKGNGVCPDAGVCCSKWFWCGDSTLHCEGSNPASAPQADSPASAPEIQKPSPQSSPVNEQAPPTGTCGGGKRGNGVCPREGDCCSKWFWCGNSEAHCADNTSSPLTPSPSGPSGKSLYSGSGSGTYYYDVTGIHFIKFIIHRSNMLRGNLCRNLWLLRL